MTGNKEGANLMILFAPWIRTLALISHTSKIALALCTVFTLPASLLLTAGDSAAQTSSSWTYCASEGGQCNFSGTREVRYGANGNYSYGIFANSVSCNNGVFGDPIYGTAKNCEYGDGSTQSSSSSTTTPTNNTSWNYCASEGGQCNFFGTQQVRYGANGNYAYGIFSNGVGCNNGVFGDPIYGTAKNCEYGDGSTQSSSSSTTTPTNNTSWNYCASEGGQCNFFGTREVRYGANGNYAYGIFSNGVGCNNGVFGDPIYGTAKNCEYGDGSTQSSSSTQNTTSPTTPTSGPTGSGQHYFVATNGNNSNSCATATNINSPKRTISGASGGLTCLATANGDWLEIRGGTYAESITTSTQPIASGSNWDNATVIKGYANETVTLAPTNGGGAIAMEKAQYVVFANLVIDGSNNPNTGDAAIWFGTTNLQAYPPSHHLRFQNLEVKNWYGNNMEALGDFSEILDSSFHDNRAYAGYGIYVTGHDNIFDGNAVFNHGGFGIHNYSNGATNSIGPSRNIYHLNEIYNTGYHLVNSPAALLLQSGDGNQAYENFIHDNAYIGIDVKGTNTAVYNNTITGNTYGIGYGFGINSIIQNNNLYQNSTDWKDFSDGTGTSPTR